jgi:hypothetical protein
MIEVKDAHGDVAIGSRWRDGRGHVSLTTERAAA